MRPPSRSRGEPSNGLFNDTEDDSQIRGREFFASIRAKVRPRGVSAGGYRVADLLPAGFLGTWW